MTTHRIALIIGGTGDLGETIVIRLHTQGYRVVVTHSLGNTYMIARIAEQHAQGYLFQTFAVNVADYDACQRCASGVFVTVGLVDILVNNAGITQDMTLKRMMLDAWRNVLATDFDPVSSMTKPLYEGMIECGQGCIINISSVNGSRGTFGQTNYVVAKAGIHGFTKALVLECAVKGVTVNAISPGYLAIRMTCDIPGDIIQERILPQIPVGRLGQPEEVAALVAFLCGEDAVCVTGANLAVNGGLCMQQRVCMLTTPQDCDERLLPAFKSIRSMCEKAL